MKQVLVDIGNDHPRRLSSAQLPALVGKRLFGEDKRLRDTADKAPRLHPRMGLQKSPALIGGTVVVDEIAVHQIVVVTKEEWQHPLVVPALRVEMHFHAAMDRVGLVHL